MDLTIRYGTKDLFLARSIRLHELSVGDDMVFTINTIHYRKYLTIWKSIKCISYKKCINYLSTVPRKGKFIIVENGNRFKLFCICIEHCLTSILCTIRSRIQWRQISRCSDLENQQIGDNSVSFQEAPSRMAWFGMATGWLTKSYEIDLNWSFERKIDRLARNSFSWQHNDACKKEWSRVTSKSRNCS